MSFSRYVRRAERGTVVSLKDRTFERRVENSYNKESIKRLGDENFINAVIETSSMNVSPDTKKLAVAFSSNIKVGDIVYWDRVESHWLVYYQRITEKNYFSGEMQLAKYEIHWASPNGKKYKVWGSLRNQRSGLQGLSTYFEVISGDMELIIPRVAGSEFLVRQKRIKINGRTYRIAGSNDTNLENIIIFYLEEVQSNPELDTDIPYGNVPISIKIDTALSEVTSATLGSAIKINATTRKDGILINDTYKITTAGCEILEDTVTFNVAGLASVRIESELTENVLELEVNVVGEEVTNIYIEGPTEVKTMLSYSYKTNANDTLSWKITNVDGTPVNKDVATIEIVNGNSATIKFGATIQTVKVVADTEQGPLEKEVKIKPLY